MREIAVVEVLVDVSIDCLVAQTSVCDFKHHQVSYRKPNQDCIDFLMPNTLWLTSITD
ncbi:MAG: hypothetical protein QOH71_3837 [Blastocatellia bacterium]|jgi:hypothetical protein|nr:hypothetical protein [Blastocatellia bacterium]